jgi:thiamine transport system ATP-binding protein
MVTASGLAATGLTVRFGAKRALDDVSLAVAPGEIVAVVGPSGCGKTTLLRAIAGLEPPDAGQVRWDGKDLAKTSPHARGFGLMFQDHALFAHRTVAENVAFGLRMKRMPSRERSLRTTEMLRVVRLEGYEGRSVQTLSGGEAQRVALARALAPSPRLLMLDEPLGSLDRSLRDRLAVELGMLLRDLGQASIHVTHDQDEALAIADRLVVMSEGRVVRDGPATEVWRDPRDEFVARFLGHDNVLNAADARALGVGDGTTKVVLLDEGIHLDPAGDLEAVVEEVRFRGSRSRLQVVTAVTGIALSFDTRHGPARGATVRLTLDPAEAVPLRS